MDLRPTSACEVLIKPPGRSVFAINLRLSHTIDDVKYLIRNFRSVPISRQILRRSGSPDSEPLENCRTLQQLGIQSGDMLDLDISLEPVSSWADAPLRPLDTLIVNEIYCFHFERLWVPVVCSDIPTTAWFGMMSSDEDRSALFFRIKCRNPDHVSELTLLKIVQCFLLLFLARSCAAHLVSTPRTKSFWWRHSRQI